VRRPLLLASFVLASPALLLLAAQTGDRSPHGFLAADCGECHSAERWVPLARVRAFRHEATGFPLEGTHARADCAACHRSLVFSRVAIACADCHSDPHKGELGARCETCHKPSSWSNQTELMRVHNRTRFPLFAAHARVDCEACHRGQRPFEYATTPTECGRCHALTYAETHDPNHASAGFPMECEGCHGVNASSWRGVSFRHDSFVLRGVHLTTRCAACHPSGYAGTPRECVGCHRADYDRTRDPDHRAAGFPDDCGGCHRETGWRPASNVDHERTRFPLRGAHQAAACSDCHVASRFAGTPTQCAACHAADRQAAQNPVHSGANFDQDCEACHSVGGWRPATLDHNQTRFPLTGAHRGADCASCHKGGRYAGTPQECVACHEDRFRSASNPNHVAGNFSQQCQDCHSTQAWRPANFDHNRTRFRLTGAHARVDCAACHPGGRYAGTPSDCYACHRSEYDGTANPNHRSAGFPTSCTDCHTTNAWRPASFDHDGRYFPIYSGKHRGKWSQCSDCHVSAGNYRSFECILCHEHSNRQKVDEKHKEVSGYSYDSRACYRCHPRGTH
jgi:nitrate/TMAO reductase-like tetraheme cytochrome c subunit